MEPVIRTSGLGKTYRYHRSRPGLRGSIVDLVARRHAERDAVHGLDLTIGAGEFVGLLGRNGAGKTTTLKMLAGLLRPTTGSIYVLGHQPYRRGFDFLSRIAIVLGNKSMLWWDVSTLDNLKLHQALYDLHRAQFDHDLAELATMLEVTGHLEIPVRKLSLGERMKCELIMALIHRPQVLFLDEPTIGLDVVSKAAIRGFLAGLNADRGTTIVLTSHDMDDVAELCRRVLLIDDGRLAFDGSPEALVRLTSPRKRVVCTFRRPPDVVMELPAGVQPVGSQTGTRIELSVDRPAVPALLAIVPGWGELVDLEVRDADLDEVMRLVLGGGLQGTVSAGAREQQRTGA
jgi:ABC-2 type transport system ATP-binding protein